MSRLKRIKVKKSKQQSQINIRLRREAQSLANNPEFMSKTKGNPIADLMLSFRLHDGHIWHVFPDEDIAQEMVEDAAMELGVDMDYDYDEVETEDVQLPKRIVFHNRMAIGDILMFTCGVRDFKAQFPQVQVQVQSVAMHIWDHNPNINRDVWTDTITPKENKPAAQKVAIEQAIKEDRPVLLYIGPGWLTNASNRTDLHFANAFRISIENLLGVRISQGPIRPDIYMTQEEYDAPPIIEPPYWLITAGEKGDWTAKTWAFDNWQTVISTLSGIQFVQLGEKNVKGKHPELYGQNVIDYIGKTQDKDTGIRDLFNLFNNCEGSMGLVSFQMHLAAAFNKPCIVIAGAREPAHFTRYPGQNYLVSDGCLPCTILPKTDDPKACWYCSLERCPYKSKVGDQEVPLCAGLFDAGDVIKEVNRYYHGGRLDLAKPIGRSKLVNVVKEASTAPKPVPVKPTESKWGMTFGGGALTDKDWAFMQQVIKENNVKTVLEFGAGLSTLLMKDMGLEVVTYETDERWIETIKQHNPDCDLREWNGQNISMHDEKWGDKPVFDLVFVDGPPGGQSREWSTKIASEVSDIVIVHDAGREFERKWQTKYLEPSFKMTSKGGNRCHLWKRGLVFNIQTHPLDIDMGKAMELAKVMLSDDDPSSIPSKGARKSITIAFNGRGEGGAERTVHWLMKQFIAKGYAVNYFSPNKEASGTFRFDPIDGVFFTDNPEILEYEPDIFLLYANDWVWEFPKLAKMFNYVEADRKVMGINYKLGKIGLLPWTRDWDKYLFLNSELEEAFKNVNEDADTKVMAPPTDLTVYFGNSPNYGGNLRLIRHSSQGDAKYPKDFNSMLTRIMQDIPEAEVFLMPAPSFLEDIHKANDRIHTFKRNQPPVREFLSYGNVFWYALPEGYTEGGPKVIMEAQASGLSVIADNHSGAKDRIYSGSDGYLCNHFDEHISAMEALTGPFTRENMGGHAREYARVKYDPQLWVNEIIGEEVCEPCRLNLP